MIDKIKNYIWNPKEIIKNCEWILYKKRKVHRLNNSRFSIIASNCVGSIIYHDLGLPFLSPTISLTIGMDDFIKFVENLEWYIEKEIVELKGDYGYPVDILEDIRINFVHYESFEEGVQKWEERKKRIQWDNLFIIGTERQGCTYKILQRFDNLSYRNKVIFTHIQYPEIKSAYYIKGFEKEPEIGNLLRFKDQFLIRRYLDDFDYVKFFDTVV